MRVYDTPFHWHEEPDVDPFLEDALKEEYGDDWQAIIANWKAELKADEELEFYNFKDAE